LEASETVWIPFKFQSFKCGQVEESQLPGGAAFPILAGRRPEPVHEPITKRDIKLTLENQEQDGVVFLTVGVRPQSFVIDRTLRYHHWEDQVLQAEMPLPTTYAGTLQPSFGQTPGLGMIGGPDNPNDILRQSRFADTSIRASAPHTRAYGMI
jgi:hypothetical protein